MDITQSKYKAKQVARAALFEIIKKHPSFTFAQVKPYLVDHMVDPVFYDAIERGVLEPFLQQGLIEQTAETEIHNNKYYYIYKSRVSK